jgi:citrate lyase beta subunit
VSLDELAARLDTQLARADARLARDFPGDRGTRQPVHTVYLPASAYGAHTVAQWRDRALAVLDEHGADAQAFGWAVGLPAGLAEQVYPRVRAKLEREPIEDLRVDFEDGYGARPDDEEDADAARAAWVLANAVEAGSAPPFHGIRFKCFEAPTRRRGLRTLDLVVGELARRGVLGDGDGADGGFVVTLPKVTSVEQVEAMVTACDWLEQTHGLAAGRLRFEIQVETPQSILGPDGTALVARMVHAAAGRCTALHYGTYDYSASCGISAAYQSMEHPVADHAKAVMQLAAAGTGVLLSDGSTNILPVGDEAAVHRGWALHARLVRRSLERGYYQGWDLHPAQLPTRYAATYAFYREGFDSAAARLRAYVGDGDSAYLDEPATAVALAGFVLRGVECGAVDDAEVTTQVGIDRSHLAKLAKRRIS